MAEYTRRVAADITKYLQKLREQIDEDISGIEDLVPSLTLEEADYFGDRVSQLTSLYRQALAPLYRGRPKNQTSRERPASSTQSGPGVRSGIEQAASDLMERQGYVLESQLVSEYSFNKNAVHRRLQVLADTYGWDQERNTQGIWAYTRKMEETSQTELPIDATPASPQERTRRGSRSVEEPDVSAGSGEGDERPESNT